MVPPGLTLNPVVLLAELSAEGEEGVGKVVVKNVVVKLPLALRETVPLLVIIQSPAQK